MGHHNCHRPWSYIASSCHLPHPAIHSFGQRQRKHQHDQQRIHCRHVILGISNAVACQLAKLSLAQRHYSGVEARAGLPPFIASWQRPRRDFVDNLAVDPLLESFSTSDGYKDPPQGFLFSLQSSVRAQLPTDADVIALQRSFFGYEMELCERTRTVDWTKRYPSWRMVSVFYDNIDG